MKMVTREKFDEELSKLQSQLIELKDFAYNAFESAFHAFETRNVEEALKIMENDTKADIMYEEIHDSAILLIAKQQPVATDLRQIITTLKISTDLERIADFAVNVAKSTIRLKDTKLNMNETINNIRKMYTISMTMLKEGIKAFLDVDLKLAKEVAKMDDEVDELYGQTIQHLFQVNRVQPENIDNVTQLLFICRFLERTADHITNIAENVFYLVKGKHYDLNE